MYRNNISHPSRVWRNRENYSLHHGIISLGLGFLSSLSYPAAAAGSHGRPPAAGASSSLLLPSPTLLFLCCWCSLCAERLAGRCVLCRRCRVPIRRFSRRLDPCSARIRRLDPCSARIRRRRDPCRGRRRPGGPCAPARPRRRCWWCWLLEVGGEKGTLTLG